jgi:hypothetical protein
MTDVIIPEDPAERRRLARALLRDGGGYVGADELRAWARAELAQDGADAGDPREIRGAAALRGAMRRRRR